MCLAEAAAITVMVIARLCLRILGGASLRVPSAANRFVPGVASSRLTRFSWRFLRGLPLGSSSWMHADEDQAIAATRHVDLVVSERALIIPFQATPANIFDALPAAPRNLIASVSGLCGCWPVLHA